MIGGQDQQVVVTQFRDQLGQAGIELFERVCITRHVAAMPEILVEIDEIGEDHPQSPAMSSASRVRSNSTILPDALIL